ncbi:MAG: Holliday junction resolvase RuvX [Caldilineales bacterium]|nr:Holliday junction resolvase RuvX [Caldilineales bacterium]
MTIYLALDVGDRRIGLAAGADDARLARPLGILTRSSKRADFEALARQAAGCGAEHLLVGLPLNMDGSEGLQAKRVRKFAEQLRRVLGLPLTLWDERLSSFEADQILAETGRRRRHNDDIAAAAILQNFFGRLVNW